MIIIVDWWRISHGKSSPTVTNLNKTIVTNPNPNWHMATVGGKSVSIDLPCQVLNEKIRGI